MLDTTHLAAIVCILMCTSVYCKKKNTGVDGGWTPFKVTSDCRLQQSIDNTRWPSWPAEPWPPIVDMAVQACFDTWQQTHKRTCTNPRRKGVGKKCRGPSYKRVPCACTIEFDPNGYYGYCVGSEICQEGAHSINDSQAFISDPCQCACFYQCVKSSTGNWTIPNASRCCPACTFWSQVQKSCIRVLEGCYKTTQTPGDQEFECTLKADKDKHKFWNGPVLMPCSPNTIFSLEECACLMEFDPSIIRDVTSINFDKAIHGSRGVYIYAENVKRVTKTNKCISEACGYFDGTSSIRIPFYTSTYDTFDAFSVSIFFKVKRKSSVMTLLTNGDCTLGQHGSIVMSLLNENVLHIGFVSKSGEIMQFVKQAEYFHWTHMVLSWNGFTLDIYQNGELVFSEQFIGALRSPDCPLVLGKGSGVFGMQNFRGHMDQVTFYKTGLRSNEVLSIYNDPAMVFYSYYMPAKPANPGRNRGVMDT